MTNVAVTGSFDNLRSRHVRLLDEASRVGTVHVLLWPDDAIRALYGSGPKFPQEERLYLLGAIRYVQQVTLISGQTDPDSIPDVETVQPDLWIVDASDDTDRKRAFCAAHDLEFRVLGPDMLAGFPAPQSVPVADTTRSRRQKVMVTGCFDWFHSGHVRFFEEVSALGDLYVGVGSDANVELLKGKGHPMFPQDERRYMVQSVRYVTQALLTTGNGWMDAAPEIAAVRPDIYAVNEDGDRPDKRAFCAERGIEYVVLRRVPKEGLPRRESTALRGF
jgi:cytidyltransferase-like protein